MTIHDKDREARLDLQLINIAPYLKRAERERILRLFRQERRDLRQEVRVLKARLSRTGREAG